MLGDVLKREIRKLKKASTKKSEGDAFWTILRDIAAMEIIEYREPIDSDVIIPLYYKIMCDNLDCIPAYYKKIVPSNKQERFRIIIRNTFSSNAFHSGGLANQEGIIAYKETNESKKGNRIVFRKK